MTEQVCTFSGDREATLIGYLYEELTTEERAAFERHAETCSLCDRELASLIGVRSRLGEWTPPEPAWSLVPQGQSERPAPRWVGLRAVPGWMQAVAAVLIVGAALGAANLNVRYDAQGLSIRTGWLDRDRSDVTAVARETAPATPVLTSVSNGQSSSLVSRAELDAAIETLRVKIAAPSGGGLSAKDVRALLADSERKQQNELALRSAALFSDVQAQRESDLVKIERGLSAVNRELLGQREVNSSMMSLVRLAQK
jgi:hypothetical protein